MSVFHILRKKRFWAALGVALLILLIMWGIGALLVVKGTVPPDLMTGWACGSYLAAGLAGGVIAGRKMNGGMTIALLLAAVVIVISVLAAWILCGGVNLADGGWKTMLFTLLGAALAGMLTAGKSGRNKNKRGPKRR